jgi:hypothetical protein
MLAAREMHMGLLQIYLLNVAIVALILCCAFFLDSSTPNTHGVSWLVLGLASVLWVVALPLSIVEVMRKVWRRRRTSLKRNPAKI